MREIAGQAGLAQEAALTAAGELLEELARRAGDLADLAGNLARQNCRPASGSRRPAIKGRDNPGNSWSFKRVVTLIAVAPLVFLVAAAGAFLVPAYLSAFPTGNRPLFFAVVASTRRRMFRIPVGSDHRSPLPGIISTPTLLPELREAPRAIALGQRKKTRRSCESRNRCP